MTEESGTRVRAWLLITAPEGQEPEELAKDIMGLHAGKYCADVSSYVVRADTVTSDSDVQIVVPVTAEDEAALEEIIDAIGGKGSGMGAKISTLMVVTHNPPNPNDLCALANPDPDLDRWRGYNPWG